MHSQRGGEGRLNRQALVARLGLDKPYHTQLWIFLSQAVRGDFGTSIRYRESTVSLFFSRLPNTLTLIPATALLSLALGIPLGALAAVSRGTAWDKLSGALPVCGIATPSFWLGIVLIYV